MEIFLNSEVIGHIGSFVITNTLVASTLVMLFLMFVAWRIHATGYDLKNRFYNFVEMIVEGFLSIIESVVGRGAVARQAFGVIVTFFFFVILNNWFGIFPGMGSIGLKEVHEGKEVFVPLLRSANSDLNMTLAIAIVSVIFIQAISIRTVGLAPYLQKFFNFKSPILFFVGLLEIISEVVKIFSFSFRLFGNIFAGDVLLIVIFSLVPFIAPIPFMGIELFAGFIQALIFSMLTLVFINVSVSHGEAH